MAIPVENVSATIVAFVAQLKKSLCDAKDLGVDMEMPETLKIRVSVIAPDGLNALRRTNTDNQGEKVILQATPDVVDTQVAGEGLTTTVSDEATSTTVETETSPEKTTTRTDESHNTVTTREAAPSTTLSDQTQETNSTGNRTASGGNTVTEDYQYTSQ